MKFAAVNTENGQVRIIVCKAKDLLKNITKITNKRTSRPHKSN